jgi:menaquinone-dependent protoporphyrinogen oxidase
MKRTLVVYASRHGGTAGIADRIGETLRRRGLETSIAEAGEMPNPDGFDACLIGSGVYMGSWLKEAIGYLERHAASLAARPVWLFSSGPLRGSSSEAKDGDADPLTRALGPSEGPGSGGRKRIDELSALIHPRAHRVFYGAFDPDDPPRALSERLVRLMPASKGLLPAGDFREWSEIEGWADEIAAQLTEPVAVG